MDREPTDDERDDGNANGGPIDRRTLLCGAGATVVAGVLAGCSETEQSRYEAAPASLSPEAGQLGLVGESNGRTEIQRSENVGGATLEITLVNYGATYDGDPTGVAVEATPGVEKDGQQLNPAVGSDLGEVLASEGPRGGWWDQLPGEGIRGTEWTQTPTEIETTEGQLLGEPVDVKTFLGLTDQPEAVVVSLARRIHREDAVLVGNGLSREIEEDSDQPLIDEENGVFTPGEVDEVISFLQEALPLVVREPYSELTTG